MKKINLTLPLLCLCLLSINNLNAQDIYQKVVLADTFTVNSENSYKISSLNIIPFSEKIFLNKHLLDRTEYTISYERGVFNLNPTAQHTRNDTIIVGYESVVTNLKTLYKRRNLAIRYDEKLLDTVKFLKDEEKVLTTESIFGKSIQKSGALIRGITIGTNQDMQINSGLRLQLSGKLSDDIDIVAALSDENTPIQPEGNTETLEELDKVFIEVKHKNATGTFGDYELNERQTEFGQLTRKLQGLKGEINIDNHRGMVSVAGSRGKFNTQQFFGSDGNQGPYRLYGINNERLIIIIAGSEKVFLDGEQLKRGENNDYVIDYSNSEITFTPKRLITSASRIAVDFEYTDQQFKRNFFGTAYSTKMFSDDVEFGFSYFREGDDENNPIDFSFSDNDKTLLENAGDGRNNAVRSGAQLAEPDSLGKITGSYVKIDTLINDQSYTYYRYNPGNIDAVYNVSFTYVGSSQGDYTKESLGNYKFVGKNNGSYAPVVHLPLPELKQNGNFFLNSKLFNTVKIKLELSGSDWDKNLFSNIDDSDNFGYARSFLFEVEPGEVEVGKINLGKIGLSFKDRFIQKRYSSLDRIDEVEFSRNYNLTGDRNNDQTLREINLSLVPSNKISLSGKYGFLKQGELLNSDRFLSTLKVQDSSYNVDYTIDYVKSINNKLRTTWNRQLGSASYSISSIKPGLEYLYENKHDTESDTLFSTSLKYFQVAPFIEYTYKNNFAIKASYTYRTEHFPIKNEMVLQSKSYTEQLSFSYRGIKEVTSSLSLAFRDKKISNEFKALGIGDNSTVLILSQTRLNFWDNFINGDVYYQASTEQSARLEKVFVKVTQGSGNYLYLGDLNENGIAEENEFQLTSYDGEYILVTTPTDKLFPVIDLKANSRIKFDFSKISDGDGFVSSALKIISTETSFRVEENSKIADTKQIYLLNFSKFLNDSTTIRGSQYFQHDFNFFKSSSDLSVRLRYIQRKSLNQYAGGLERGYFRERGLRIRFKMITEITNQTDIINQSDNYLSPTTTNRTRQVDKNEIVTDFTYRPIKNIETGFKINFSRSEDLYPVKPTIIDLNSLTLRINYSIANYGRIRFETERTELTSNVSSNIPYEITRGNVIGKNYFWRVFFDYKITGFIQTSLSYDGRLQGKGKAIHTMRAEARAFF